MENASPSGSAESVELACMEVWGGNRAADNGVSMSGVDAWVYCQPQPGNEQGGDVYFVSSCATGRITRCLLADVAGHGESVGKTALELRSIMRKFVNHADQRKLIDKVNRAFEHQTDAGVFATVLALTYWSPTGTLTLCNGGHPPPLIYRASTGRWSLLEAGATMCESRPMNIPLGITEADYDELDTSLEEGDLLVLYTDALIETPGSDGQMLMSRGLLDLVRSIEVQPVGTLLQRILSAFDVHRASNDVQDDMTIILIRSNGSDSKLTLARRGRALQAMASQFGKGLVGSGHGPTLPEFSLSNIGGFFFNRLNRRGRATAANPTENAD